MKKKAQIIGRLSLVFLGLGVIWGLTGLTESALVHFVLGVMGLSIALKHQ